MFNQGDIMIDEFDHLGSVDTKSEKYIILANSWEQFYQELKKRNIPGYNALFIPHKIDLATWIIGRNHPISIIALDDYYDLCSPEFLAWIDKLEAECKIVFKGWD